MKQKVTFTFHKSISLFTLNVADSAASEDNKRVNGESWAREILGW